MKFFICFFKMVYSYQGQHNWHMKIPLKIIDMFAQRSNQEGIIYIITS